MTRTGTIDQVKEVTAMPNTQVREAEKVVEARLVTPLRKRGPVATPERKLQSMRDRAARDPLLRD